MKVKPVNLFSWTNCALNSLTKWRELPTYLNFQLITIMPFFMVYRVIVVSEKIAYPQKIIYSDKYVNQILLSNIFSIFKLLSWSWFSLKQYVESRNQSDQSNKSSIPHWWHSSLWFKVQVLFGLVRSPADTCSH